MGQGQGETKNEAIRNAIRNAVENAVGVFIVSETKIENYKIDYDRIFTFPNAIVNRYELLESSFNDDSKIFDVKVKVYISDQILKYTIKRQKNVFQVDADNLYAKTAQKFEMIDNAKKMIDNFKSKYFNLSWDVKLSEVSVEDNYANKSVTICYKLKADIDSTFYDNLYCFLVIFDMDEKSTIHRYKLLGPKEKSRPGQIYEDVVYLKEKFNYDKIRNSIIGAPPDKIYGDMDEEVKYVNDNSFEKDLYRLFYVAGKI